jgi:putative DNA primase/helicase
VKAAEIAAVLGGAHRSSGWWRCVCPVHGSRTGRSATLALCDGDRGIIVVCHAGCSRADILAELRRRGLIGGPVEYRPVPATVRANDGDDVHRRIAMARRIWDAAQDARGSPVAAYLASRGITIPLPPSLRWAPRCPHPSGVYLSAMVARIVDSAGELIGVHRTYLQPDGSGKADVEPAKAMLGRAGGGAVRLAKCHETMLIGEGLETCLSAMQACGLPAWAALSTSGVTELVLPPTVRRIILLADKDSNGAGERAARTAAARWIAEGRRVRVALPPELGTDFNDVLLGRAHARITEPRDAAA